MIGSDILNKFNLYVDDASELSDSEAYDLANDVYNEIADDRPWEWLRAKFSGVTSITVPYIALPTDFKGIMSNFRDIPCVFKVTGTVYQPYQIIPYDKRYEYINRDGYAYIDPVNSQLVFTYQPTAATSIEYDYTKVHTALAAGTSPLFRGSYHKIISYGMAAKFGMIEQTDKGNSYANENAQQYERILSNMAVEDANAKLSFF